MSSKWFLLIPLSFYLHADTTLLSLINSAQRNEQIESLRQKTISSDLNYEVSKKSYLPRVDGFSNATFVDHTGGFDAKRTYVSGVKAQMTLFNGFKNENAIHQNRALYQASLHELSGEKKALSLGIIHRYYELQNTMDAIRTHTTMRHRIEAQILRLEKFRSAGLASEDTLLRMRSELSAIDYTLSDLVYALEQQKADLTLITTQSITALIPSTLKEPISLQTEELDVLKALRYERDAKMFEAKKADSGFWPTLTLEDHYGVYRYENDPIAAMRVDTQNKLTASLSLNLLDFSSASTAKQALFAQAHAHTNRLAYASKEAKSDLEMAVLGIERSRSLIQSAQSAHHAAQKTFEAVEQKYNARIVDYVTYLDALHTLANATNQLERSKRSLQSAYAQYYYCAGYDPKDFIQ